MKRRTLLTAMGLGLAAAAVPSAWLVWNRNKETGGTVFYGPPVMPTLLLGAAAQQGRLKDKMPFAVKVWKDVDMLRAGLANRSIAVSIVPSYVAANLAARGQDVKLLNIMTFGLLHIIGTQALPDLAALKGKKLVMPFKNDMPDLMLQWLCRKQGVALNGFQTAYTATPPEALMMFMRGNADYALLPEPMVSMAMIRGAQMGKQVVRALDIQEAWMQATGMANGIPQAGLMADGAFYRRHTEEMALLQQDLAQALTWTQANPEAAAALAGDYLDAPEAALLAALPNSRLAATPALNVADDVMRFFKELHSLNPAIVGGKLPDASLLAG